MAPTKDTTPPEAVPAIKARFGQTGGTPDAAAFDWGNLAEPVAMPNKQGVLNIKVNVLETVPGPIRVRAEASLAINAQRVADKANSAAKRARINYHWDVQPIPDAEWAGRFRYAISKYAKYRPSDKDIPHAAEGSPRGQVTARTGDPGWFRTPEDGVPVACSEGDDGAFYGVRYSVRPFEQRSDTSALPGTA
jgi:hypothetical protein